MTFKFLITIYFLGAGCPRIIMDTPDDGSNGPYYNTGLYLSRNTGIVLKVKACSSALVLLSEKEEHSNGTSYIIFISGWNNSISAIR